MGEMYARICSWENLRLAHHKAARGKRGKRPAAAFEYNLAESRVLVREPGEYGIGPAPGHPSLSRATLENQQKYITMPYWRLFYHFVWGTKNREPMIAPEWEDSLHNVIAAKATKLHAFVHAVGGIEDHVHLVVSVPPKIALSTFIGQVKGNSSHFVNRELDRGIHFAWQGEYGVVSFGGKVLDRVVRYVKDQRGHHTGGTTIAMLEQVMP